MSISEFQNNSWKNDLSFSFMRPMTYMTNENENIWFIMSLLIIDYQY